MGRPSKNPYFPASSSDEETECIKKRAVNKDAKLWDSFQDPPEKSNAGSDSATQRFLGLLKVVKVFIYLLVFIMVLAGSVFSKASYILMTTFIKSGSKIRYCDTNQPEKEIFATIPEVQRIGWIWALIFAFAVPEVGTIIRAGRICFFRNIPSASWRAFFFVATMETFHVLGLALFTFFIIPELDAVKAVMLTNCLCLVPSILGLLSRSSVDSGRIVKCFFDLLAISAQLTGLVVWPLLSGRMELWCIPVALVLISFRWAENYVSSSSPFPPIRNLALMREHITEARYSMYLFIAPWKLIVFMFSAIIITGVDLTDFFTNIVDGWSTTEVKIQEVTPLYSDINSTSIAGYSSIESSSPLIILWIFLIHIIGSYITFVFAKFAAKIHIQSFSSSFPIALTVPVTVSMIVTLCGLREGDVCFFSDYIPNYLFFQSPPVYFLVDYIVKENAWVWLLWLFSQIWITIHLWSPRNDRNAPTEKLFISPMYSSLVIDQSVTMNRQRTDQEEYVQNIHMINPSPYEADNIIDAQAAKQTLNDIKPYDKIPQVFICATMWHENKEEMMEFLKSILRLDEDQCARRLAMKYIQQTTDDIDSEYYELETHIFFDDAFVNDKARCEDPEASPLNDYVKLLINNLDEAAREVYKTRVRIYAPTKIVTPYGGRLVWTLPGRTKMIAHLKDKNKIRHKKRWSQVMYMYYLLGYRIMQMDASPERKMTIAQNTYLLALDGDIDFQPNAVTLLIGRMKVDPDLGAACGRIHPVGSGPMVWYQVFEYAIGHWLQKATEHVIGCVLCSPGCFSLFRGRALMENSVMRKYTTTSEQARHYVQYDQGEDRWLCTLLLKQKFRVEYSAASDAYTHAPEGFFEFYNQRRRWVPSTMANILDLLGDAKNIVMKNNSISMPYIIYQAMLMVGTIVGPGTIFLMMVGALVAVFSIDIWTSFLWNFIPLATFMGVCYFCKQKYQLTTAFIISTAYSLVMMAVMIGIIIQVIDDGILSPSSLFFFTVALQVCVTGLLHPQEWKALIYGVVYYLTIPSMYMLLVIYSLFNMNDVSWGTRENPQPHAAAPKKEEKAPQGRLEKLFGFLKPPSNKEDEGSLDISFAGLFRCMMCTRPKTDTSTVHLIHIADQLREISTKMKDLELRMTGEVVVMRDDDDTSTAVQMESEELTRESLEESEKAIVYLPDWLYDVDLKNSETETLSSSEEQFWKDLLEKYLKPLEISERDKQDVKDSLKGLRDIVVFAFVMLNALFVLIVFLLQLQKEYLHIQWPFNAVYTITYTPSDHEFIITPEYLQLEPIGLVFVLFFGLILVVQFFAMLVHRFGTISQILPTVTLDWYCGKDPSELTPDAELKGAALDIAKSLQRPQPQWDEDDLEEEQKNIGRRDTIHRILYQHGNTTDWSNLEANFKRRYLKEGDLNLGRFSISRKTLTLLDTKRKSVVQQRTLRKSQLVNLNQDKEMMPYESLPMTGGYQTAAWIQEQQNVASPPMYRRDPNVFITIGNDNNGYECTENLFELNNRPERRSEATFA